MSTPEPTAPAPQISPVLALQLRVRWLEALIHGLRPQPAQQQQGQPPLTRRAQDLQDQLGAIVRSNDAVRHFVDKWDTHAHLLSPAFALSPTSSSQDPSLAEFDGFDALLADMESDIRSADSALREIAELDANGATGAGNLAQHEALQPRLRALLQDQDEDVEAASQLEKRVADILRRYSIEVDVLSELFVSWNGAINAVEDRVAQLERERGEKQRLGLVA
ncbi:hypothetical protein BKA62DRAFT_716997 [Auriculariales sp. MPI-PUGE-AT-0066]|nr:hypothetical protein BKA62DRAFT_716997 [Auriculariales sp. MPI-PUGE-AT-0066]